MCGICGFTGQLNGQREAVLEAMNKRIRHRGPDDSRNYLDANVAFGFRRLSFLDLQGGQQPMQDNTGNVTVVFNGEIYNYGKLKEELQALGHVFNNTSDTETLVYGYKEWGTDLPQHLRGMYAFVIHDKENGLLFGARDHFGIKPLYYSIIDGEFVFASEIKSILEHPGYERAVNTEALEAYLTFQYSVLDETFFKGIYKMPPAHQFIFKDHKLTISRYWTATFNPDEDMTLDEAVASIDHVMKDSTEHHQIADVEVGSLLSSGIDSSLVVALGKPDKTFTVGFDYEKFNEIPYAEMLSEAVGVENTSQVITTEEYWNILPYVQYYMDEPLADASAVALYFVDRLASKQVKAVLSGEGADELFGGYVIYHEPFSLSNYQKLPKVLRKGLGNFAEKNIKEGTKGRSYLIRGAKDLRERFIGNAYRFTYDERRRIMKKPTTAPRPEQLTAPYYDANQHLDETTQMQLIDINFWLIGDILLKGDRMSMANSLETRVPFLDKEVFNVASKIPVKHRIANGTTKYALRQAAKSYIPEVSANKKKLGFPVPIGIWLKDDQYYSQVKEAFTSEAAEEFFKVDEIVQLLEEHRDGTRDNSKYIWVIYMFLLWYKAYFTNPIGYEELDRIENRVYN